MDPCSKGLASLRTMWSSRMESAKSTESRRSPDQCPRVPVRKMHCYQWCLLHLKCQYRIALRPVFSWQGHGTDGTLQMHLCLPEPVGSSCHLDKRSHVSQESRCEGVALKTSPPEVSSCNTWVFRKPFCHIVHLAVDHDPAVILYCMGLR